MRTFDEIVQQIAQKKNEKLPEANTTSLTGVWWIWANIVALAIHTFEQIVYAEQEKLQTQTERKRYGTTDWYADQTKIFQWGDPLVFDSDTGLYYYEPVDVSKQIVKRAAVNETVDGKLIIKVAKEDNGILAPLDPLSELPLLLNYIQQIKVAGTVIDILSLSADSIDGVASIYYDGNYAQDDIKQAIETALTGYRDHLPFNGVVLKNELIDTIRAVEGIDDVFFDTLTGQPTGDVATAIVRNYNTKAGYFNYQEDWLDHWIFIPRFENPS